MGDVIKLFEIHPQEEIFCQNYVISVDASIAAYHSGMCQNIKDEIPFDKLNSRQRNTLSQAGSRALRKKEIKARISEIAAIEAEKNNSASLEEILNYLTLCVRKSRRNFQDVEEKGEKLNTGLVKAAIDSINVLIKRYPDFADGEKKEPVIFKRGV